MEWVWITVAALLGGIGNGLAGISAATVLVPILIVLCPTFAGETGAFAAMTLALTCDIPSSAVTAAVYMRHGNIDLRRGWVMLVCVLSMSIVGSIVAYLVGGAVLGGFSLILTLGIGIRYLVKPGDDDDAGNAVDSTAQAEAPPKKGFLARFTSTPSPDGRLDAKAIGWSLFFGLTIGFGTGFVGTGGGMMMFIVFTAFLGYTARKAVGTATFIMTGTAAIASIAHYLIDATLIVEHLDIVIVCVVIATVSSLISARFANRTSPRTVGLACGVILTVMAVCMIALHYRADFAALGTGIAGLFSMPTEANLGIETLLVLARYVLILAAILVALVVIYLAIRKMPREVFRKLLHAVAFSSGVVLVCVTSDWRAAALACVVFAIIVYPILSIAERWEKYPQIFNERRRGEVKKSMVLLFGMTAALIALAWGLAGHRYVVAAALLMWGFGDAAAGLVGRRWGKYKTGLPFADPKKTWEGTAAYAVTAFVFGVIVLAQLGPGLPWWAIILQSAAGGCLGAMTELVSKGGNDTVTCPAVTALFLCLCALA